MKFRNTLKSFCLAGILLYAFLSFGSQKLDAQNSSTFHHLSVADGLSQSTVNCIFQDSRGFIWIGTLDGLNRYDGYTFKHYKHVPNDTTSISAPVVNSIFEDVDGKLWIGTDGGGLNIFDLLTEKFTCYKHNPADPNSISGNQVYAAVVHNKGSEYLVGTFDGGLNFFDKTTKKFTTLKNNPKYKSVSSTDRIANIIKTHDGMIWIATRDGLKMFNNETGEITIYKKDSGDDESLFDDAVLGIYEAKNRNLWIGTLYGGICEFDISTKKFVRYDKENKDPAGLNFVYCFNEDNDNKIWIGTSGNGIKLLDKTTRKITPLKYDADNNNSISSNEIFCFLKDRSGLLWIGTNGGGIDVYDKSYGIFNRYDEIVKSNFSNKNIYSIYIDKNETKWFGTNGGGLYSIGQKSGTVKHYSNIPGKKNSISNNNVWSMCIDKNETFWVGTFGGSLNQLNRSNASFSSFYLNVSKDIDPTSPEHIMSIFQDSKNILWIATNNRGLYYYDPVNNATNRFIKEGEKSISINSKTVYTVREDATQNILVGTLGGGLNLYNKRQKSFTHYVNDPTNNFSISNNDIYSIYIQNNSFAWIGTNGGGLNLFDKRTGKFIHYTEKDGLPNNVIYCIEPDRNGNLWLSTNKGICKFHVDIPQTFSITKRDNKPKPIIKNYSSIDGLSSDEFNQGASYIDKEGYIYFGSINGITCFHPDSIKENTYKLPVVLTTFKVFEKNYPLDTSIEFKKVITLNYDQDFFSFEFAGLNYLFPEKNQYAYMMEGFDRKWNYIGNRRYASFTNLNHGNYTFKVKACNNDGVWNENYTSIQIVITPPFWKTWWFKSCMVMLLVLSGYTFYKYRIHQIKKEEQKKTAFNKALAEVEMKALRAQMNPHFIFNSLNSINKYIVSKDQRTASDYLSRFSRLIRLVLENSMHKEVALDKDLETLELYMQMEQLRFEKGFEYEIKVAERIDTESVLIPPLLLQPFVENAIWHGLMSKGEAGKISISINSTELSLHCVVEDNGIGREKANEINAKKRSGHQSLGMKVTEERIEILKQQKNLDSKVIFTDLKDQEGKAIGTKAEIIIPLEYSY